jgi:carbon monoxide dehydrogenase subunit G
MDKLLNEFTVHRPIDETWSVLTEVERIAPCMPGAALEEIEGDIFRGVVKVKLGAISTAFKGQANFVERDDTAHRAVLKAEGRDTTGKGNASAMITAQLESIDAGTTRCKVETDLHITGKVAQFGRGIMGDVSKKLMNQFATNLNTMLDQQPDTAAPAAPEAAAPAAVAVEEKAEEKAETEASDRASANGAKTSGTKADGAPTVRKIDGPAAAPIELSDVAGSAILKRLLPLVGGLVLLWLAPVQFGISLIVGGLVGGSISTTQALLYALAPQTYPTQIRGTGVGSAVSVGRLGSGVGPLLAGAMLDAGALPQQVLMVLVPTIVVSGAAALGLCRLIGIKGKFGADAAAVAATAH